MGLLLFREMYTLTVGYHELTGSKVPLKKLLLILKKAKFWIWTLTKLMLLVITTQSTIDTWLRGHT
ncbi:hypothetical protein RJ641_007982 [Dillenia turbinata]|uniref:Uncharacterized protein n=1 Tax=Dillenia turbinata TaxID=194707 RepID=A0AAN8VER6_9MAGN